MGPIVASPIEWAYLAGVIDGEGCVDAVETKPRTNRNFSPNFRIRLNVTNTSEHLINWIHDHFGGYLVIHHRAGEYKSTKTCWNVKWNGGAAEIILRGCLPYLIVKKYQAELAFKLRGMILSYGPRKGVCYKGQKLSEEVITARRDMVTALKLAKKTQ